MTARMMRFSENLPLRGWSNEALPIPMRGEPSVMKSWAGASAHGRAEVDRQAERWLRDIYEFIVGDNPPAASRTVQAIYEKAQVLSRFPETGYRYHQVPDRHIRILLYGHYRIAYLIKNDGNIDILGVFHGALDIERYLI